MASWVARLISAPSGAMRLTRRLLCISGLQIVHIDITKQGGKDDFICAAAPGARRHRPFLKGKALGS